MSGSDEFDDFLARRKPVFRRAEDDPLEPPPELDRLVLRRAREAIESDRPEPMYHGPRWGMPVALAATLLVALTVILHVGMQKKERVPEVTVQNAAQEVSTPAARPSGSDAAADTGGSGPSVIADLNTSLRGKREAMPAVPGGFVSENEAARYTPAPPPPPTASAGLPAGGAMETASGSQVVMSQPPPGEAQRALDKATSTPAWRHDETAWQAEIQRLRAAGKTAEADSEQAEFNRQHRAYAGAPDR